MELSLATFSNALRALHNIDACDLDTLPAEVGREFVRDPVRFFLRADDPTQAAIWDAVQRRTNRARKMEVGR